MSNQNPNAEQGPLILVAEDSPTQAEQLRHLLEQHNYRVLVAENGQRALDLLADSLPTLIISDIVMPEINGYELCKRIKADERTRQISVILLTSLSGADDVLEGLECGADYFMSKPYSEDYFLQSIERSLANREMRTEERARVNAEIVVGGEKRSITADLHQALSLLVSSYDAAVRANTELVKTQNDLQSLNARLE